ncbi:MAG: IPT/TIG domain-containing protein [Candidatus Neomarinimicrobiota bacterium]
MKFFFLDKILLGFSILIFSCEEPDSPDSIWDENDQGGSTPIVDTVEPSQGAFAGIDTLTIIGQHFSENLSENLVYFNGMLGNVVGATSTSISVVPPNLVSDSVQISVAVQGSFVFGKYENLYTLSAAVLEYGPFDQFTDIYSLDLDRQENLIVSLNATPDAQFWIVDTNQDSAVWSRALAKASGMKLGPTGSIYFVNYQRFLYRDEQGTEKENTEIFKRLNGNATDLDFDENGNLFLGGTGSTIDHVDIYNEDGLTDGVSEAKNLDTLDLISLKVFNNFLYVLTTTVSSDQAIYKIPILDNSGSLGDLELVFDWSNYTNKEASALCLTLSESGDIFVGSDWTTQPLTMIQNGSASGFYNTILTAPIVYMAWGNGNYLYVINKTEDTNRVQKIDTRITGASYFGRP